MASSGEDAELQPAEYASPYKHVREYLRWPSNAIKSQASVLVCPFRATVETWQCNLEDSEEMDPLPM